MAWWKRIPAATLYTLRENNLDLNILSRLINPAKVFILHLQDNSVPSGIHPVGKRPGGDLQN
jgi:hypothetical protein